MEVIIAENSGFCFGVERAINTTLENLETKTDVCSLGPLIHNDQVVGYLDRKGLEVVDDVNAVENKNLIIRSHGVPLKTYDIAEEKGNTVIDCTCPFVRSLQKKAKACYDEGLNVIIIGDRNHPEIIGIDGWCENNAFIVNSIEDIEKLPELDSACVVVQTTMIEEKFNTLVEELKKNIDDLIVYNTICRATRERQESCDEVSRKVDAMVVVGGKSSSNTKKLAEISAMNCDNVYHIELASELDEEEFKKYKTVGLTAGASTPDWIIKEVYNKLSAI